MAGGQAIDLFSVGRSLDLAQLQTMHALKTGALIHASAMMGVACAHPVAADEAHAVSEFATHLGLAFQVVDDVLDVEGNAQTLGKSAGKDAADNKPTFVSLLGLDAAKRRATEATQSARDALAPLGARAAYYRGIADEVLTRKS
jgi:farnesyl diphosphate synthase